MFLPRPPPSLPSLPTDAYYPFSPCFFAHPPNHIQHPEFIKPKCGLCGAPHIYPPTQSHPSASRSLCSLTGACWPRGPPLLLKVSFSLHRLVVGPCIVSNRCHVGQRSHMLPLTPNMRVTSMDLYRLLYLSPSLSSSVPHRAWRVLGVHSM